MDQLSHAVMLLAGLAGLVRRLLVLWRSVRTPAKRPCPDPSNPAGASHAAPAAPQSGRVNTRIYIRFGVGCPPAGGRSPAPLYGEVQQRAAGGGVRFLARLLLDDAQQRVGGDGGEQPARPRPSPASP